MTDSTGSVLEPLKGTALNIHDFVAFTGLSEPIAYWVGNNYSVLAGGATLVASIFVIPTIKAWMQARQDKSATKEALAEERHKQLLAGFDKSVEVFERFLSQEHEWRGQVGVEFQKNSEQHARSQFWLQKLAEDYSGSLDHADALSTYMSYMDSVCKNVISQVDIIHEDIIDEDERTDAIQALIGRTAGKISTHLSKYTIGTHPPLSAYFDGGGADLFARYFVNEYHGYVTLVNAGELRRRRRAVVSDWSDRVISRMASYFRVWLDKTEMEFVRQFSPKAQPLPKIIEKIVEIEDL